MASGPFSPHVNFSGIFKFTVTCRDYFAAAILFLRDIQTGVPDGTVVHVQALIRGTALLPCDLTAPNDTVVLVVWYKDEHSPIYSYDTRGPYAKVAKHWKDDSLENRAYFRTMTDPSTLNIDNVSERDEGEYRCRIDYLKSPTRNARVKLTVVIPPQKPKIIDDKGKEVPSLAGPYEEGGDMKLTCIVTGGKPEPQIKWWREGKLIESTETRSGFQNVRSNQLIIRRLQRSDQHAAFTCQASNNNISQPVSATTSIEIYFRPLSVEILSSNNPLSANRRYELPCQTFGSRPPAKITWIMDGKELEPPDYNSTQTNSEDGNSTISILTFVPTKSDNGRSLTCKVANHLVHNGVEEHTVKLNVFYVPAPNLTLGSNLNPDDIEEGDDVYFECDVDANPWPYKVLWRHNGQVMQANQKGGVIMSTTALALQGVTRGQAGNYSCVASNVEGDGDSRTLDLRIMYKPICRPNQKNIYGAAKHEIVNVSCEVEAYPAPDSFEWSFNSSSQSKTVPQSRFKWGDFYTSTLTYTPVTELDYGTVICKANNLAGAQKDPCIFHIIAAGKPDPPYNCTIVNMTNESLEVECTEGFDGGQPQFFLLEVYDWKTGVLQANVSSKFPIFIVNGLDPGKSLKMHVYAANSKGKSETIVLEGFTLKVAEKQTVLSQDSRDRIEIAPILGILVGIVTALLLVTVVVLGALKVRAARRDASQALRGPGFLKEKATLPLRADAEDVFEKDDKNPDIIPSNKDSDYQLGSAAQTPAMNNSAANSNANEYEVVACPSPLSPTTQNSSTPEPRQENYGWNVRGVEANEVTYAELSLARPNSLETVVRNGPKSSSAVFGALRAGEPTIYAQIDHSRRPGAQPLTSPAQIFAPPTKNSLYHREVVTVRTPLMGCQQESCV